MPDTFPDVSAPDWLLDDLLGNPEDTALESDRMPDARALRRRAKHRFARLAQRETLADVIRTPPAPGETLHILSAAKWDYWTWVPLILTNWLPRTDSLYCSTWTLNATTVTELLELWDGGKIGQVHFLTGLYFTRRETATYARLLIGIRDRGGQYRAFHNHAKILLLHHGRDYHVITGSANLTGNPRAEQYDWTNDHTVWTFYRDWFAEMLRKIPPEADLDHSTTPATRTTAGKHQRRAGLGVYCVHSDAGARAALFTWKDARDSIDLARFATELAGLIRQWQPVLPSGAVVTCPPQGASWPGDYAAANLAAAVAELLDLPFAKLLERTDKKTRHHPKASLDQTDYTVTAAVPVAIVIDDAVTSGNTMRLSLAALRAAGITAWGFAYAGC